MGLSDELVEDIAVTVHTIPTHAPEADGTLSWDSTTIVIAEIRGAGKRSLDRIGTSPETNDYLLVG